MALRQYATAAQQTTLSAGVSSGTTTMTITAAVGLPSSVPWTAIVDRDTVNEEVVEVTSRSGTTLTVTRGIDGSSALAHSSGAVFQHGVSARDFAEPNAHVNASTGVHGLSGAVVGTTDTQTLSGKTMTSPVVNGGTQSDATNTRPILASPLETTSVSATAATGTINVDCKTQTVYYYTSNAAANWTFNFRGDAGSTLSSILAVGGAVSVVFLVTNGGTAYYPTTFQIDGVGMTPKWAGGSAPSAGSASSVDAYSFTIVKTAATPTYVVLAGQARFA